MPAYPCSVCGTPVEMPAAWFKKRKHVFCSDECRNTPIVECQCCVCGKSYLERAQSSGRARFCSKECENEFERINQTHRRQRTHTIRCEYCGTEIDVRRNDAKVQKYCSRKCARLATAPHGEQNPKFKPKVSVMCDYCGKEFEIYPSRQDRRKYCCAAHRILGNFQRLASGKRTSIEIKMATALDEAGIGYSEQVLLFDKFLVDFLLTDHPIVIQCDGEYWHNRKQVATRDKGQDHYLRSAGYIVLRFTDKEINSNIHRCVQKIRATLQTCD